jgi:DNA-binding beta-propeller fold protein YncE
VLFVGERLVVSNTHLDPATYAPLEGYVTVVDPATGEVKNRVATRQPNPQKLALYGDKVLVLSTGPITYDFEAGDSTSGGPGGLDLLDAATLDDAAQAGAHVELAPSAADAHLGAPVDLVVHGDRAYVTSATSNALFVVDLAQKVLERGPENPVLYGGDAPEVRLTTGSITGGPDRLYIADFNADAVHVVDPATNSVSPCAVDVGLSPMDNEGATAPRVDGEHLYVLLALAQAVRRVSLADLERVATAAAGACPEVPVETFTDTTGMIPNDLVFAGGALHIVSSGDNAVYRYDPRGERTKTYVLMPDSNPWSAAVSADGRHLAVTEWVSGAVSLIDTACDDHLLRVTAQ